MFAAQALRKEHFRRAVDHLSPRPAEQLFRTAIEKHDVLILVNSIDSIFGNIENTVENPEQREIVVWTFRIQQTAPPVDDG
jgi:hypothetical protein